MAPVAGAATEGVAVIGLAGRFPGAPDVRSWWRNLRDGVESIRALGDDELRRSGESAARLADPRYVRAAAVLQDVEAFDAAFFSYSPRDARLLDPQQRLFLETAWAALEDAGHGARNSAGTVGVWAAGSLSRYLVEQLLPAGEGLDDLTTLLGNDKDFLAARVAWHLGLTGPSITVQSGCSSSLLAVAQACQALTAHQCDLALAGGVSLRLPQERGYVHVPDSILSPDGHCRPFDARAAGTVFGSGVGVVVLRRLADALAAGDTIHAVVRGAAVNNDGDSKQGFTAPSVERQAAVVAMAHALAGLESRAISFVEAHGTATALGDAVEVAALTQAFRIGGARTGQCVLGSVKGNVGHLDVASGIAGLLKAVLALEHACIPPTLHFERPNPALGLEDGPFRVNAAVEAWKRDDGPRRAGVSSLGMGGTNVHVVLEQAPPPVPTTPSRAWQLLPLSARTEAGLDAATDALAAHLRREADVPLADVAFTLQAGRRAFEHRRAFVVPADGRPEQLVAAAARGTLEGRPGSARPSVAFLFPGQGSQHAAMAAGLYATERVFREHVDACCELLQPHLGLDLRPLLDPASGRLAGDEDLARTELAQPALFVVEYALARLWMDWGVQPETFFGHSVGEYVAACLTQVFRLEHALPLVALRGRLLAALPPGAMCAVPLAPAELEPLLEGGLALAAVNAPRQCVAAGPIAAVERLEAQLAARGLAGRRLAVTRAFHSPMVEPVLAEFAEAVRRVPRKPPEKLFVSGVTGTWITAAQAVDPDYWARQLRATVRCADGLRLLRGEPARVLLEVGPGRTLTDLAGEADGAAPAVASLRHPRDGRDDVAVLLEALGRLWVAGVPVDWPGFARRERRRRVPLPTYPFARTRHWLGPSADGTRRDAAGRVELSRWFHVPGWSRAPAAPPATLARGTRWLVLAGDDGAWEPLLARLREAGQELLVEAASRADARRLAEAVAARGVTRILHLPLATTGELSDADAVRLGHTLLVELVEALAARGRAGVTLDVLARRAHDVTGEPPAPERATLLGAFRCLPQEHPGLRMRLLDVDVPDSATAPPAAVEAVLRELALADGEPLVALRGGHRWRPTLEPLALESPAALPALRPGGTYLLTGGLGGVGLTLAGFLARTLHANLVLVGRRGLPPPERRDEAPAGGDAETHAALRAVRELQAAGAQVLVEAADVASRADLQRVVDAAHRRFGALDGVIHAAGVAAEGLARRPGEPLSDAPLRAKVQGTRVLADVLGDEPAFVVLCSATATALGGLGQAAYVAGNAYLDAFATARAGGRTRWLSLAWDTWRDVGMARRAVVPEALRARQQQVLAEGLDGAEAVEVFRRALAAPHAHLLVSTTPIAERRARVAAPAPAVVPAGEPIAAAPGRGAPPAAGAAPPPEAPADEVEAGIAHIWTQLLGLSSARRDDSFFEHGGNSLLATQMLARLRERFPDSEVSLPALFARPTIAGLAEQIRKGRPASAVPAAATAPGTATLRERVLQATGTAREALLVEVLTGQLAEAFGRERLPAGGRLEGLDPQLLAAHLSQALRRDLALAVYPPEIRARATVAELARLVDEALQRAPAPTPGARLLAAPQQPAAVGAESPANGARAPIAFLLSSPRSGSTLLRLMLSAHPELFCPPELFLLDHEGLRAWASDSFAPFYRDGLVRALMVRLSLPFEAASRRVDELVARDAPAREVYELLLEGGSLLVDKTPTYALDARALLRAETLFDRPRYVGLVRHPYAVIDSMVRNRLDRVRGVDGDPHELAERTWFEASRNLLELGRRVGERFHLVHYERLVRAPEEELRALCRFLQVPFDPAVLDPYGKGHMFGGPGDPNIHARGALDARLGERWREVRLPRPLGAEPGRLALSLDYELPLVSGG